MLFGVVSLVVLYLVIALAGEFNPCYLDMALLILGS